VEETEWKVGVFPGEFQLFKGTAEGVHPKALALNTSFKAPTTMVASAALITLAFGGAMM
jgi:hypothetical protein